MRVGLLSASFLFAAATVVDAQSIIDVDQVVATGLSRPVYATSARDGSGRLFIVEQGGRIRVLDSGSLLPTPFLDLTPIVASNGEQGLLSVAFHPRYATNGFFYINYTDVAGHTVVARYRASADPDIADPASASQVIRILQPFGNHNGGQLQFGPLDGYLYIGMGDGGSARDPFNHGQDKNTLLGDLLRIDVDSGTPYAIPPDNPYVGTAGADEIWASGLRNPWRFSFDRDNGDLYIGDVGQSFWEEIDFQAAGTPGGLNFGWVIREGPCPLARSLPCAPAPAIYTNPIAFYGRSEGGSTTGGFVYRGSDHPSLDGRYYYGDFISGRIWSIAKTSTNPILWSAPVLELQAGFNVSTFGEDEEGELYVADYFGGTLRRLRGAVPPAVTMPQPGTTLSGRVEAFAWIPEGTPVQEWWIYAGSTVGGKEYFDSGSLGASTGANVTGLPTDGSAVHVRLWFRVRGLWRLSDFSYTAATIAPGIPAITAPSAGSTLTAGSNPFQWTDNFAAVQEWWLYAGSSVGGRDYYDSGSLGMRSTVDVPGLPTNGSTVHVRLWFRLAGVWEFVDATYTAATVGVPEIVSPAPGSILAASTVPFQWTANGEAVAEWWLYVGSASGGRDIRDSGSLGSSTSSTVSGIPTDGRPIHVRLWYRVQAQWRFRDFQYTSFLIAPAITAPAPGSTFAGSTVSFSWASNGAPVTEWWLYAGRTPGGREHLDSGSLGTALQATLSGLPTDGSAIRVRLWYRIAGLWQFRDFSYTAAGP